MEMSSNVKKQRGPRKNVDTVLHLPHGSDELFQIVPLPQHGSLFALLYISLDPGHTALVTEPQDEFVQAHLPMPMPILSSGCSLPRQVRIAVDRTHPAVLSDRHCGDRVIKPLVVARFVYQPIALRCEHLH